MTLKSLFLSKKVLINFRFFSSDGSFLNNIYNLELGKSQSGELVDNVILPKWAKVFSSLMKNARDFININRAALESDHVSSKINDWIDLIFGYKQKAEEAFKAENLFYYLTYDSCNIDLLEVFSLIIRSKMK